jgi:hypothetical protein
VTLLPVTATLPSVTATLLSVTATLLSVTATSLDYAILKPQWHVLCATIIVTIFVMIMAVNNKCRKSAARGTKAEGSVRLGSEFLTREEYNARFPICKMAQDVINALKLGGDKSSVFHLTNCFRGFSKEMQEEMAFYLIAEMHYRITGKDKPEMTGLFHVDRLLIEILYILDHDTKNLDDNE